MKKTLHLLILAFTVFLSTGVYAQYSSPESVTYDPVGKRYFISNTSSGKIVQRSQAGVVTDFVTVGGSIHGVTVYNDKVYVCNGTRIKGYNLSNAAEVFNVQITGATFCNDLAADTNGVLYVSDFSAKRIYKVNTNTSTFSTFVPSLVRVPNGVYVDYKRNRLLLCTWGGSAPIQAINLSDSTSVVTLITTPYSNCDGISLDRNDNVYVSAWSVNSVARYDINFSGSPVIVASALSNPADIYVNRLTDTLAVPNAGNSTVSFVALTIPTGITPNNNISEGFKLHQNYPNPFNPETIINYELRITDFVSLNVYSLDGKLVKSLVNSRQDAGTYSVTFDGAKLSSGVYFYELKAGEFTDRKKMLLVK